MGAQELRVQHGTLDDEARRAYERARRFDPSYGLASIDEVLRGAELFDVVDDAGRVVLRYALRVDERAHGREGNIVAAAGRLQGVNLCDVFLPVIERQFAGADTVKIITRRKALGAKLIAAGYEMRGFIFGKRLCKT